MTPSPDAENNKNRLQPIEGEDDCGPHIMRHNVSPIEHERVARQRMLENLHFDPNELPAYPRFASYEQRLRSYENWPAGMPLSPEVLTEAGFFYSSQGDITFCYQCGGMLQGWSACDDPSIEHAKYYPSCKLASSLRGNNMVIDDPSAQEFRDRVRAQENMKEALNTVREVVSSIDINKVNPKDMKSAIETLKIIVSEVDTGNDNLSVHENYDDDSDDQHAASLEEGSGSSSCSNPKSLSCLICLTGARNALLLPCHHIATCCTCASKLKNCCVCRLPVTYHTRVYIS